MRFYQTNPVVREVDEGMQRMVQVGMDLYRVECKDSSGASVPVSSSRVTWEETETLFKDLMQLGSGEGTPDSVARDVGAAAAVLTSLPLSDAAFNAAKEKVVKASKTCAEYLNAGKTGTINGKPGDAGSARPGS